jgi:hypothetical protein
MADVDRVAQVLAEYEAEYAFVRQISLPVEDRMQYMPQNIGHGPYRWFRSPNVVCLEKYRQLKAAGRI